MVLDRRMMNLCRPSCLAEVKEERMEESGLPQVSGCQRRLPDALQGMGCAKQGPSCSISLNYLGVKKEKDWEVR